MNKKDLIDSFENLTPSDSQKQKMLNNVLNSGMEKQIHRPSFNFRYGFTTAAAAICAVMVVVVSGPWYNKSDVSQVSEKPQPVQHQLDTGAVISPVPSDDTVADKTDDVVVPPQQADEVAVVAEEVVVIEQSEDDAPMPFSRMVPQQDAIYAYAPELVINNGGYTGAAGGGGVPSEGQKAAFEIEKLSLSEYCDYLGVNVPSIVDVPEGFSFVIPANIQINRQMNDKYTFEFRNGSKHIYITTTKYTAHAQNILDSGALKSDINGNKAVVNQHGDTYTAYIISRDVQFTIDAIGVTEADLANLLLSIAG